MRRPNLTLTLTLTLARLRLCVPRARRSPRVLNLLNIICGPTFLEKWYPGNGGYFGVLSGVGGVENEVESTGASSV